jgi:3-deoxy-D-manno-octulosonic-acid transferase
MQSDEDARRIMEMGARPETVKVTGNMKYDRVPEPVSLPDQVGQWAGRGFLLVAGSTHSGEEEIILDAVRNASDKSILLALVPRHPERFDEVADLLKARDLNFSRYSEVAAGSDVEGNVMLVDAMGVLDGFYALADVAFVGGSLVPVGGHNLLEPAMHGVPVLTGTYTHNFREIAATMIDQHACITVGTKEDFAMTLKQFEDENYRKKVGRVAAFVSGEAKGASKSNIMEIAQIMRSIKD